MTEPWKPESEDESEEQPKPVEYAMIWRFVDQSPAFTNGVEAGVIYERMERREALIVRTVRSENEEELRNLANSFDYHAQFDPLDEAGHWFAATFTRAPAVDAE